MSTFAPLKITFHLDGTGIHYDPAEPIHLDSLLVWCAAAHHPEFCRRELGRDDPPDLITIPVARWRQYGSNAWGWCASALFPEGPTAESLIHWRKRFRVHRIDLTHGSPNLTNATYREWNMPLPLLLTHRMVAYCVGDRRKIRRELIRGITHLGKKAAHGRGAVTSIEVERVDYDWSLVRDGRAMRWLPDPQGARLVRTRPPYWNRVDRVPCCEVGDPYDVAHLTR